MTTMVTIEAHCNKDTEVQIQSLEFGTVTDTAHIKDGEKYVVYAYGQREIRISEVPAL